MKDAIHNLEDCRMECALWQAKKEILELIVAEQNFTLEYRDDMDEEDRALYVSALDLLSDGITEYGILPWDEKKGE